MRGNPLCILPVLRCIPRVAPPTVAALLYSHSLMEDLFQISTASSPQDLTLVRRLFEEYAAWLGFSLEYQGFAQELADLPGKYGSPQGRLLLARCQGVPAGCGALRPLSSATCEMKRLYVRPEFRGRKLGLLLAQRLVADARLLGYQFMRLDTVPAKMGDANRLYRAIGFYEIEPYYESSQPGTCFLERKL